MNEKVGTNSFFIHRMSNTHFIASSVYKITLQKFIPFDSPKQFKIIR